MTSISTLPAEVLHLILQCLDPSDLAAINGTCQDLSNYLQDNELLYKELYLSNWVFIHGHYLPSSSALTIHLQGQTRPGDRLHPFLARRASEQYPS